MKTENKNLKFKKTTITNLNNEKLGEIKGGNTVTGQTSASGTNRAFCSAMPAFCMYQ